jgi:hypothetical protein
MKVELKNPRHKPNAIKPLIKFFQSLNQISVWEFKGLKVELDPTIDCKNNDALIRWTDINEGFNDKLIVKSLEEFNINFKLVNA